jgi:hypothetical protein
VAFTPDGRTLAVSRSRYRYATSPSTWHQEIWSIDLATGARRMIFHLKPSALAPAWVEGFSPNGRWLLFWEDSQNSASLAADGLPLVAIPAGGGRPVTIARSELHYPDYLTWCGNTLVYVINHGGRWVTQGDGLALTGPPAWRSHTLIPAGGKRSWTSVACPTRAAAEFGGGSLVVSVGPTTQDSPFGNEHRSLWAVSPSAGSKPQPLVPVPPASASDERPMWAGDGRWLLFVRTRFIHSPQRGAFSGHGQLYGIDPFGGNLVGPIADVGSSGNYYGAYSWAEQIDWHRKPPTRS